ncbi:MAG: acetyl-CoA C-acetyltransferase [Albidovulum sp.]|nr:acetyl-CoA C-acetyltransferase [Albidovulum sp.]
MKKSFIFDAIRTPRGRGRNDGSLYEVGAARLSADLLNELKARNRLDPSEVEDVIWGNVTQVGEQGGCLARASALLSDLGETVPGLSINRFCASGLEAINLAANQIASGAGDCYIAGGVEMMSRVPMGSDGAAIAVDPSLAMERYFVPQGISADLIATMCGFSRRDCDAYAAESHRRASRAWSEGRFEDSVVAVRDRNGIEILGRDEAIRPETSEEALGELKPSFAVLGESMPGFDKVAMMKYPHVEKINHVHHAGNSSSIVDGAAAVLVGSGEFGERTGLKPRARIVATSKVGTEPTIMLTGPVPATKRALGKAGMDLGDIDLYEVNEAFASVVLRFVQEFEIEIEKMNVNGGAIAMGHPLGATGAMLLGTALDELERADKELALVTLCVAAGMGAATILERV